MTERQKNRKFNRSVLSKLSLALNDERHFDDITSQVLVRDCSKFLLRR